MLSLGSTFFTYKVHILVIQIIHEGSLIEGTYFKKSKPLDNSHPLLVKTISCKLSNFMDGVDKLMGTDAVGCTDYIP